MKTNKKPKPSGGKGPLALDWTVTVKSTAQLIASVDLESERVWICKFAEFARSAQQKTTRNYHLFMFTEARAKPRKANCPDVDFRRYLIEKRHRALFGTAVV